MAETQPLYEIVGKMLALHNMVEAGELTDQDIADTLEALDGELEVKAENIWRLLKNQEPTIGACVAEIKRLDARKKAREALQKKLRTYLAEQMERAERKSIKTPLFSISLTQGRESVKIDDVDQLPDSAVEVRTEIVPKLDVIAELIKAGTVVAGAHVERGAPYVTIR